MTSKKQQIEKLREKITRLEADISASQTILEGYRAKLAVLEEDGPGAEPRAAAALIDITPLWQAALKRSRHRSSKQQCRQAWAKIPVAQRPEMGLAVTALQAWNKCEEWTKDACAYAPGLHLYIQRRQWEDPPEIKATPSRYRQVPKPAVSIQEEQPASAEDLAKFFRDSPPV